MKPLSLAYLNNMEHNFVTIITLSVEWKQGYSTERVKSLNYWYKINTIVDINTMTNVNIVIYLLLQTYSKNLPKLLNEMKWYVIDNSILSKKCFSLGPLKIREYSNNTQQ